MPVTKPRRVLIIVENLPAPFDRRVWQEATTLKQAGYEVSIISPIGKGYEKKHEIIDGIHVFRHPLPVEASRAAGYALEYSLARDDETDAGRGRCRRRTPATTLRTGLGGAGPSWSVPRKATTNHGRTQSSRHLCRTWRQDNRVGRRKKAVAYLLR